MGFQGKNISYQETGLFPKILMEYVKDDPKLRPFYEYAPSISSFAEVVKNMGNYEFPRKLLSDSLSNYYKRNASGMTSDATLENMKKLEDKNCFTVTTGHQLCLFTGPLYFIFKIITTINLAEKLNKEYPANHFVPVYWMASEDHDFAEINHVNLFGKKVEWEPQTPVRTGTGGPKGALNYLGGPVGRLPVNSLSPTIDALFATMGDSENAKELKKIISDSYSEGRNLAEATFSFVNALLGKYGLVILEPDNADFKQVFSPIITDELLNGNTFKQVSETNQKLIDAGIKPEVNPREVNLFYMDKNGRNRIENAVGANPGVRPYKILNTDNLFTGEEIKNLVKTSPGKFSPNVLLRPVYQQSILPNVAYIGGPSEIAYWLQLKGVFDYYKVPFPVLMPRNSALIVSKPFVHKMDKLNITEKDLFKDTESLIKVVITRNDGLPDFEKEAAMLKEIYASLGAKVNEIDPTLVPFTQAELQKQLNAFKTLETKLMRVKKQKEETSVIKIRKLKETLFPNGVLQERAENFIPFFIQYGAVFFDMLKENFDPFGFGVQVLKEE